MTERIDAFGEVVVPLDRDGVLRAAEGLLEQGVETLAVSFLWSHLNPVHEDARAGARSASATRTSTSATAPELAQRIGEYPRTATAVLNSYIGPLMRDYVTTLLSELERHGYGDRLLFAQCDGGLIDAEDVIARPVMTLESGPVGGVVACVKAGAELGQQNIIAADMGGTTFDVSVISDAQRRSATASWSSSTTSSCAMVDVESVGAGGGCLAWVDPQSGALRVGPQSAGADPRAGLLRPRRHRADRHRRRPRARPARPRQLPRRPDDARRRGGRERRSPSSATASASACWSARPASRIVADSLMEDKIRSMTVARGHDPRDFVLYAFGGGGAVHAGLFARGLGIGRVVVPVGDLASVWSAYGIGLEGYGRTYEVPVYMRAPFELATIADGFDRLDEMAREDAARSGVDWGSLVSARSADLKYALQVYDVEAEVPDGALDEGSPQEIVDNFERNYAQRFGEGVGYPEGGVDMTALRLHVRAGRGPAGRAPPRGRPRAATPEPSGSRDVYWPEHREVSATPVYTGPDVPEGARLTGPALLDFPDTTVVLRPGLAPGRRARRQPDDRDGGLTWRLRLTSQVVATLDNERERRAESFADGYMPPDELVVDPSLTSTPRPTPTSTRSPTRSCARSSGTSTGTTRKRSAASPAARSSSTATTSTRRSRPRTGRGSASAPATSSSAAAPTSSSNGRSSTAR